MTASTVTVTVALAAAARAAVDAGTFVRVDLARRAIAADGTRFTSVLVGRPSPGAPPRAYANVCRHEAIPLDARADAGDGVMTDDGRNLFCHAHGAVYRPADGLCTSGPCLGASLATVDVVALDAHEVTLRLEWDRDDA